LNWPIYVDIIGYIVEGDHIVSTEATNGYPFQRWKSKLPTDMIYPFKKCKFFDTDLNCPNKYLEFIANYDNGYYEHGSIAYPDTYNHKLYISHWTKYLNDEGPDFPLTHQEIIDLNRYAKDLHDAGYASFYSVLQDPKEYEKYRLLTLTPKVVPKVVATRRRSVTPRRKKKSAIKGGRRKSSTKKQKKKR
jgi:hypothetical protein